MEHAGHWYLSAAVWFFAIWYAATICTEKVTDQYARRSGAFTATLRAAAVVGLFVAGCLVARLADAYVGIFADLTSREFTLLMSAATFLGIVATVYVQAASKRRNI